MERIFHSVTLYPEDANLLMPALSLVGKLARAGGDSLEKIKAMKAVDVIVGALEVHAQGM